MTRILRDILILLIFVISFTHPISAEENTSEENLFGDWGGIKSSAEESGISLESVVTHDYIANTSGGVERTSGVLGNIDLTATVDSENAGLWKGGKFFLYGLGNYGKNPTEYVGDAQGTDNIEAYDTAKLYEAWYEHSFLDDNFSLLAGLHDVNSEFNALEFAGTFINSSFGISPDISQVGPSIFPYTALGVRAKWGIGSNGYILGAIYDGVPGDENHPRGTRIKFGSDDGTFSIVEAGMISSEDESSYKIALGGWSHTSTVENYKGEISDSNSGGYFIAESKLFSEETEEQGLGAFFQYGYASPSKNMIDIYTGAGLSYTGLIPHRDEDVLGFGVAHAHFSSGFREITDDMTKAETTFELTYRIPINSFIALQPDVQYVVHPSGNTTLNNATVLGVRAEIAL